ncbi:hypothetical protein LSH36_81g01050 [Paralvinella palmiformis]|uniref:Uncharacterized protein n=1 Tax=Paralvinella palmiformis TaxID=53620 RepID=A0AAD9K1T3_9ANNE|nr:hypothetical protein LSH36_81g01050 [Paralvinella palmiformis]
MNKIPPYGTRSVLPIPDNIVRALRDKDRIIRVQAKRIELLERDIEKLRNERDSLSTKLALLSYKLEINSQSKLIQEQAMDKSKMENLYLSLIKCSIYQQSQSPVNCCAHCIKLKWAVINKYYIWFSLKWFHMDENEQQIICAFSCRELSLKQMLLEKPKTNSHEE